MTKQEKLNQETEAWMKEHDDILCGVCHGTVL